MRIEQWQQVTVVLQHGYGKKYPILITINTGKCANMLLPIGGVKAYYYLYQIKKMDAFHNASLGTHIGFSSAKFEERPYLPHGLNGIIVSNDAIIGRQCQLYHQVTIGGENGGSPVIGDNVLIGAGAKIIGPVKIGNNVKIGAGCVVTIDVPDDATVVMDKPRIILHRD